MAFSVDITLGGVSISSQLLGEVRVSAKESEARTATFTLNPPAGSIDVYDYIGQSVTIDYNDGVTATRLFTGIVHLPAYTIATGLLQLLCTDALQEVFETETRSGIDALLPGGYWDDAVFNDPEDNWTYAEQRISTMTAGVDKSPSGVLRVTDWLAKATPDYTFTDGEIVSDSLSVSLAERRNITNSIKIEFRHRIERLWQRELDASLDIVPVLWETWMADPYFLPTKTMISEALGQWVVKEVTFDDLPPSGTYGGSIWVLSDYGRELAQGFDATVAMRFKQNVDAVYTITVQAPASITAHGLLEIPRQHAATTEPDINFTQFDAYQAPTGTLIEPGNYVQLNQSDPNNALLTILHQARAELLRRHRSNSVQFSTPIQPNLDLIHTVRCNHSKVQAKGKVYALDHVLSVSEGFAITTVQLAIYLPNAAGQTDDALTPPASPYADPSGLPDALPALGLYIGNADGAPVQDPNWLGWVTNYETWGGTPPAPPYYDVGLTIEFPEIVDGEAAEYGANSTFSIAIPQDELVIIK